MVIQGVSYPSDFEAKKRMTEMGRRLEEKGFVIAGEGSLSVRVGPNAIWITAEGADKAELKQEHFVRVDLNGKPSPASRQVRLPEDLAVHLAVYGQNPELRGVIHAYPPGAVGLAEKGLSAEPADYTPSVRALGRITLSQGGGEQENGRAAALACRTDSGILVQKDGCFMWGTDLQEALYRLEALEYYVKMSRMLGRFGCGGAVSGSPRGAAGSAVPVSSCGAGGSVPAENPASGGEMCACAAPDPAAPCVREDAAAASPCDGLTGLIRPGDPFPGRTSAPQEAAAALQSGSPVLQPAAAVLQPATAVLQPAAAARQGSSAADSPASRRDRMMAEVVRRSLEQMGR